LVAGRTTRVARAEADDTDDVEPRVVRSALGNWRVVGGVVSSEGLADYVGTGHSAAFGELREGALRSWIESNR
jgi:hypothetical protein